MTSLKQTILSVNAQAEQEFFDVQLRQTRTKVVPACEHRQARTPESHQEGASSRAASSVENLAAYDILVQHFSVKRLKCWCVKASQVTPVCGYG